MRIILFLESIGWGELHDGCVKLCGLIWFGAENRAQWESGGDAEV